VTDRLWEVIDFLSAETQIYWSEPQLECKLSPSIRSDVLTDMGDIYSAYFDAVSSEFEMEDRIETINQKIDYASEVQSTLRALLTEVSCLSKRARGRRMWNF
jgi:hypothetical protein